jgi:hypothetical protein
MVKKTTKSDDLLTLGDAARPLYLLGIYVRDGEASHAAVLADDVHAAPVGNPRHGRVGDGLKSLLVVECGGEQARRLGEEGRAPLGRLGLAAEVALLVWWMMGVAVVLERMKAEG